MKVLYGTTDVSKYVLSYTKKADFQEGLLFGQTPIYEIDLQLNNIDKSFGDLGEQFTVFEGENQTGVFTVYEKPERYTSIIELVLYDNMIKLNPTYDSKLDYDSGVTIQEQLEEIEMLSGVSIDFSNLPSHVLNKIIKWYDNTLSMRNYVGWIAEISGMNALVDSIGMVIFKGINSSYDFEIDRVGDIEIEESFEVSRVYFTNGLLMYEFGEFTGNTIYLSENNPYIDDESLVQYIYNKYNGLKLTSIPSIKMPGIRELRLGDVVKYNDITFLVLSLNAQEYGGESYPIYNIEAKLDTKNTELVENRIDDSVRIRRLQVLFNQNEAMLSIVAQDVNENKEAIAKLELSADKFEVTVSKVETLEKEVRVTSIASQYAVSTSKTTEPTSWVDNRPTLNESQYLWMREKYTYSDGSVKYDGVRMISAEDGKAGTQIVIEYALSNSSTVPPSSNSKGRLATPVIELLEEQADSSSTTAVLGEAVLGEMILGEES